MKNFEIQSYDSRNHGNLEDLCAQTQEEGVQMLPLTPEKIVGQTNNFVTVELNSRKVVAYCAQITGYEGAIAEIGSLIVDHEYRGMDLAIPLARTVTMHAVAEGKDAIAFCNPISEKVFAGAGYEPMKICEIPPDSLKLCTGCPKKPTEGGCCDRVYLFKKGV